MNEFEINQIKKILENEEIQKINNLINKLQKKGENKARTLQRQRTNLEEKVRKMVLKTLVENECFTPLKEVYFATFTFNEEHYPLNRKSFTTYLKRNNVECILYPDIGESTQRLHFHGYVRIPAFDNKHADILNHYGFTHFEKIDIKHLKQQLNYTIKYSTKFNFERLPRCISLNETLTPKLAPLEEA